MAAAILQARCVLPYGRFSNLEKVENMMQSSQEQALKSVSKVLSEFGDFCLT